MQKSLLSGLSVLATITVILTATAPSASAADTTTTFSLTGGSLSVSAQPTAAWGEKGAAGATSVSGPLGNTVLTDNRGVVAGGWNVGASTSTFGNGTTTASAVSYSAGAATTTGTVTALSTGPTTLSSASAAVMTGTLASGNNTATWNPTLTVTLPPSSTVGNYTGTITTSLL